MTASSLRFDVAVLGGGNAGLCAAITAAEAGASVVVIESAPRAFRGGNSRHTRNLRCMHEAPSDLLSGAYSQTEYVQDVLSVTGGRTDRALADIVVRESAGCPAWMMQHGVRFQPALRGTLHLDRTNAFFLGGGKALLNSYYSAAARLGVTVMYDTEVVGLDIAGRECRAVTINTEGRERSVAPGSVVLAAGGFEANLSWLAESWGEAARNFVVRGTPYNKGRVLKLVLDGGAQAVGDATQMHAVAVDARAPVYDGGIVTRLDCIPLGIVVNRDAVRFYDEGEDAWPKRYAVWGRLIAQQPGQIGFVIVDAKVQDRFMPSVFPPIAAPSIAELAVLLGLSADVLERTVATFNEGVRPGRFDHAVLDDCRTEGLSPNKSHWAQRIETPPFWAYPLRPGVTFTYLGVRVDASGRVLMNAGPATNVFAAGEMMAGNILGAGYVAGLGMTIGTVFGRIAGEEAARIAAS